MKCVKQQKRFLSLFLGTNMETGKAKEVEKSEKETMNDTPSGLAEWKLSVLLRFAGPKSFCFVLCVVLFCQSKYGNHILTL